MSILRRTSPVIVRTKGYLVLGNSTSMSANGGTPVDYAYGTDFTLGNSGDEIVLLLGGTVIHSIGYGDYKDAPYPIMSNAGPSPTKGVATGMALDYCHGAVNSWALQTTTYGTLGNKGTPGAANSGVVVCQPPRFLPPTLSGNQLILDWTGSGVLMWSTNVLGPWTEMGPTSAPPQTVNLVPGENRFFRIKSQ